MGRRRGGCVLMALGIVLALIGGVVAFVVVNNAVNQPPPVVTPKRPIWVAKEEIPDRAQITAAVVDKREWPVDVIPGNAISVTANLVGQYATEKIRKGQPILTDQIKAGATVSYTTYPWPVGKVIVAVPFPKASDLINAGVLQEGSTIDMILNVGGQYVLGMQNLKVFAIGEVSKPVATVDKEGRAVPPPANKNNNTLFFFNVTPEDALTLKFLSDLTPDFWVRSPLEKDEQLFTVPTVNASFIAQKFRLQGVTIGGAPTPAPPGGVPPGLNPTTPPPPR